MINGGGELVCSGRYVISGALLWLNAVISSALICIYVYFAHPIMLPVQQIPGCLPLGKGDSRTCGAIQSYGHLKRPVELSDQRTYLPIAYDHTVTTLFACQTQL